MIVRRAAALGAPRSSRAGRAISVVAVAGAIAIAISGAFASRAEAQIVNVQGSLAAEPTPGWSGQVGGGVDWQTGNTHIVRLSGAGNLIYRRRCWLVLALARGEYSEGRGVRLAEKSFEHLRLRFTVRPRVLWEAFVQHEYDAFRRLSVRALAGTGPAVRIVDRARGSLTAGLAYLVEYEAFSELAGAADSGASALHHRASSYLTGSLTFGEQVVGTQTLYAQPRLDDPADVLLLSETSLTSKLTRRLSLANGFVLSYDASPPATIHKLTTALRATFTVSF